MNGATALLSASTSRVPKRTIMISKGKSQNLLRTRRNFQNSLRNDILFTLLLAAPGRKYQFKTKHRKKQSPQYYVFVWY